MSKFCTNCGAALEESTKFCTSCGTANETVEPAQEVPVQPAPETVVTEAPVVEAPVVETPATETPVTETPVAPVSAASPLKKLLADPKKLLIPAIAVVAVIVALILVLSLGGEKGNAYEGAIDTYFDFNLGKASKSEVKSLFPDAYWAYLEQTQNKTFDDYYATLSEYMNAVSENLQNEYGSNIKVTYQIEKEWTVSERNQARIDAALVRQYGFEEGTVEDAYKLETEITIKGSQETETDGSTFYVVKIDGDWYLMRVSLDGEDTWVRFWAA